MQECLRQWAVFECWKFLHDIYNNLHGHYHEVRHKIIFIRWDRLTCNIAITLIPQWRERSHPGWELQPVSPFPPSLPLSSLVSHHIAPFLAKIPKSDCNATLLSFTRLDIFSLVMLARARVEDWTNQNSHLIHFLDILFMYLRYFILYIVQMHLFTFQMSTVVKANRDRLRRA